MANDFGTDFQQFLPQAGERPPLDHLRQFQYPFRVQPVSKRRLTVLVSVAPAQMGV